MEEHAFVLLSPYHPVHFLLFCLPHSLHLISPVTHGDIAGEDTILEEPLDGKWPSQEETKKHRTKQKDDSAKPGTLIPRKRKCKE
jgi:hypothetical protein